MNCVERFSGSNSGRASETPARTDEEFPKRPPFRKTISFLREISREELVQRGVCIRCRCFLVTRGLDFLKSMKRQRASVGRGLG